MTIVILTGTLQALGDRLSELLSTAGRTGLDLLVALVVGLVGWAIARALGGLVLLVLRMARFNEGIRRLMGDRGTPLRHEPAALASWAVQWTLIGIVVMLIADMLGFDLSASVGDRLRDVLPRIVAATLLLVAGIAIAMALGAVTRRLFESADLRGSRVRGQVVTVVLSAFAVLLALEQLGLAAQFIMALGITTLAAIGLAAGLAFGLGCRDLARDFVVEYLRSLDDDGARRPD
jgi:hypothetical protein